jgi:hypothetical protein
MAKPLLNKALRFWVKAWKGWKKVFVGFRGVLWFYGSSKMFQNPFDCELVRYKSIKESGG